MLRLETKLTLDAKAVAARNLTDRFGERDLQALGEWVYDGFEQDDHSRFKWKKRNEAAMDLAMQIQKDKSFPWPGCSNIAFPLVTIAILQYHARAYPAIIQGNQVAKMRVIGEDPTGEKAKRARRVSDHMSYQCMEQDQSWEEQHDRLLINQPAVGTVFTKDRYEPRRGLPITEMVLARDLVLDYWAKSVETCPRKTHIIPLTRNEIYEKVMRGTFRNVLEMDWYKGEARPMSDQHTSQQQNRAGTTPPARTDETTPFTSLEQHVNVDLDGDGYAEPYIITIEYDSKTPLRIVTGFDRIEDIERTARGEIIQVQALQYFTKYGFVPSPDGGIMDLGFGLFLGPLNESVNSIVNQLVDAGTMGVSAGGFLGRGAKMRGGNYTFAPFQWQRIDASGDDLRKNIFPLPVRDPSAVMFNLLNLLITYTNRVSGATDMNVGETPGQNTPAETSRNAQVQGEKIYSSIYKRTWRSMKEEFKKRYILNGIYLSEKSYYGDNKIALKEDYLKNPDDICPAADPHLSSEGEALAQAMFLKQSAQSTAGYDHIAVEHQVLRAMRVPNIEEVFPGPESKRAKQNIHPKVQIEQMKQSTAMQKLQFEKQKFVAEMQEAIRMNNVEILKLQAEIVKLMSDVEVDRANVQVSALNAQVAALKARNEGLLQQVDRVLKAIEIDQGAQEDGGDKGGKGAAAPEGRVPGMAGAPGHGEGPADAAAMAGGAAG